MARSIVGIFPDRRAAKHAILDLKAAGFDPQRMGIVMHDRSDAREVAEDEGVCSAAGAVTGGVIGGTAGALLAATGALAVPGIGPFISGGVLASLIGGTAGWLIGGLAGLGVSHDEAQYYQIRVEQGGVLVTVDPEGRDQEARHIMLDNGAEDTQPQGGRQSADHASKDTIAPGATPIAPEMGSAAPSSSGGTAAMTPASDTMADSRRGISRETLSGTLPNIPPDATRIPRQDSASAVGANDQPLPPGQQLTPSDDQMATGNDDTSRQTIQRRPAMDEDIIQGRTHGTVGDEDVKTDNRDQRGGTPDTGIVDDGDRPILDDQSGHGA